MNGPLPLALQAQLRSTPVQQLRARSFFAEVPEFQKEECLYNAVAALHELTNRQQPSFDTHPHLIIDALALFFPPAGDAAPMPQAIRNTLKEVLSVYVPRPHANDPAAAAAPLGGPLHIETAETREKEIKYIWLGDEEAFKAGTGKRLRASREAEPPYTLCYPQTWLLDLNRSQPCHAVFMAWSHQVDQLIPSSSVAEMHKARLAHLLKQMQCWFLTVPPQATPQTIPYAFVESWFHTIEQILEVYLLSTKLSTSPSAATAHFNTACASLWQARSPLDYWTVLKESRVAKPLQPQDPHRFSRDGKGKHGVP